MKRIAGETNREVTGLAYDSRAVEQGFLFFAIRGFQVDGNRFAGEAVSRGAAAIISEQPPPCGKAAWIQVADGRAAMAGIASNFYEHPSREITVVGVTGTNGKTTTAYLLDAIFHGAGRTAMMGTVEQRIGDERRAARYTTPESPDTQLFLRRAVDAGCRFASMEVSSHALQLRRCDALQFRAAIFTNLTRDHLDFHGTMENYYAAKRRFFTDAAFGSPLCVINRDDPQGERLWNEVRHPKVSFGLDPKNEFCAAALSCGPGGICFRLEGGGDAVVQSPLAGLPNVYNILGACAAGLGLGIPEETVCTGVGRLHLVPGRMEQIPNHRGLHLFVDYAHTDDALKGVLQAARLFGPGRLIVLFGCGGDRDRSKRPLMGQVAARYADFVVLTSDNPRTEDPEAILDQIEPALRDAATPYVRISNRGEAIRYAVGCARAGNIVILAGKGHEKYQIVATEKIPFCDREEAMRALEEAGD
ncbi:MAG: UDP-N-acetylmuramoyl-L-alanyl-D-glutamate--2,6-diaminopimelate ligase [Acidobacteria bacterium]|nr:UDP-N-acetylmuramoyl-L-alanyl-D-glutamate--2,6-diaminopimelate ligase [Acidobacteriota bacterium]